MLTRDTIIEAADRLFYQHGFEATSFADIAAEVKISRGNFYYHFKTKDEILDAVIVRRLATTESLLAHWEATDETPEARIGAFIDMLIANRAKIMLYGCPVGTLCSELAKLDHAGQAAAGRIMALFRDWLARQFGYLELPEADDLAVHLLGRAQGVAVMLNTFRDEAFLRREVEDMRAWLRARIAKARH